jgi:putative tryptophan/tyrosine transport system substrate-binding protein
VRRRIFLQFLSGSLIAGVSKGLAQPSQSTLGVLNFAVETDIEWRRRQAGLVEGLRDLGWTAGVNLRIAYRHEAGEDLGRLQAHSAELARLQPDVLVAGTTAAVKALRQAAPATPIVFCGLANPVERGVVKSLARPGGNTTGFTSIDVEIGAKWLQMLKEIAPHISRLAAIHHPANILWQEILQIIEPLAKAQSVQLNSIEITNAGDIERGIEKFSIDLRGGLIVLPEPITADYREKIIALADQYRLPAIYGSRSSAILGGLIAYGIDYADLYRRAAVYVDRILRGTEAGSLPVQRPTKFELAINLKTAKKLGLTVPQSLLIAADELIE